MMGVRRMPRATRPFERRDFLWFGAGRARRSALARFAAAPDPPDAHVPLHLEATGSSSAPLQSVVAAAVYNLHQPWQTAYLSSQ